MDSIFNFNQTYAGAFTRNGISLPCTLSFPDHNIVFTIIRNNDIIQLNDNGSSDLSGYISTEKNIMNFKAFNAYQIADSITWNTYSKEKVSVQSLIVSNEKNNIHQEVFAQANVVYDNLDLTGNFAVVDQKNIQDESFKIKRFFEEISFIKDNNGALTLQNTVSWKHQFSEINIFSVTSAPYFSFILNKALPYQDFGPKVFRLAWFLQLLFGVRQAPTDLILFDVPVQSISEEKSVIPYYFFNKQLISQKMDAGPRRSFHPVYEIDKLIQEVPICYIKWEQFTKEQKLICRLYFNEINSKEHIRDDRFKNFCAIIQGLEIFESITKLPGVKGEMNRKLRNAVDITLETLLSGAFDIAFLHKLFEMLGDQRDHYQHLSKKLKFDFNERAEDMVAVNALLQTIIRYHLLKAISFQDKKIAKIIQRDISLFQARLHKLQNEFSKDKRIQ